MNELTNRSKKKNKQRTRIRALGPWLTKLRKFFKSVMSFLNVAMVTVNDFSKSRWVWPKDLNHEGFQSISRIFMRHEGRTFSSRRSAVRPSVCSSVSPSVSPSVYLSVRPSIRPSVGSHTRLSVLLPEWLMTRTWSRIPESLRRMWWWFSDSHGGKHLTEFF